MRNRVELAVNSFQTRFGIRGLALFRDWIIEKAGIDAKKAPFCRFYYNGYDDNQKLFFKFPDLDTDEHVKLATFFEFPDQLSNNTVRLSEELIFQRLLPSFMADIEEIAVWQPGKLHLYQKYSQDKIDYTSRERINTLCEEILTILKDSGHLETNEWENTLNTLITSLDEAFSHLSTQKDKLQSILDLKLELEKLFLPHQYIASPAVHKYLIKLVKELDNFVKVNQIEVQSLVENFFMKTIKEKFLEIDIDISKCDILEHIWFAMLGSKQLPIHGQFMIDLSSPSQMHFHFSFETDADDDILLLLNDLRTWGEDVAYLDYREINGEEDVNISYKNFVSGMEIELPTRYAMPSKNPLVCYGLVVDGEIFDSKIFPKINEFIDDLKKNDPDFFKSYQEESKNSRAIQKWKAAKAVPAPQASNPVAPIEVSKKPVNPNFKLQYDKKHNRHFFSLTDARPSGEGKEPALPPPSTSRNFGSK